MKEESLSLKKPVTRYYISNHTFSGTSFVVVSSFNALLEENKKTLEFLVFSWDDPANIPYPHTDRSETLREGMDELFEHKFSGSIRDYILAKQIKKGYINILDDENLDFTQVERNTINTIAFPFGVRLLEIIILATESEDLKDELRTLRDFILLINSTDGHSQ